MKVGIGSYALRWAIGTEDFVPPNPLTPFGLLEKASELGAEVVQICDNVPLDRLPDTTLTDLAEQAAKLNLTLEVGIKGSRSEHLRRHLAVAERLGARLLRVVLASPSWKPSVDELVTIFKSLSPELHARDITVAIENHFYLRPAELAHLVKRVDDPLVGVCLDPLNSITLFVSPAETIATLAPLAVSVHVKNACVTRPQTGFYIGGCPLDQGQLDLPDMLDTVRAAGRSPNLLVECWMDQLDNRAATLAQEEAWTRQGIVYLRELLETYQD
jgi:sugar phosphate isomerase/epimerase